MFPNDLPWIEKYRPKSIDDISHQQETIATLKSAVVTGNLPHMLFYGPPGTGKTSTILALAKQLYGSLFKDRTLELNASDERGIAVIQKRVKTFAQAASKALEKGTQCPSYKLIILDEADSLTVDAQNALRRTMETYTSTTRFCLICNYVSKIIEPLVSRCAKFRFKPLTTESILDRLKFICNREGMTFSVEMGQTLMKVSDGDLRKAINYLQSAYTLFGNDANTQSIITVSGIIPDGVIQNLVQIASLGSEEELYKEVTSFIASGYPASQALSQLFDHVISSKTLNVVQKSRLSDTMAKADKCLQDGADEFLQIMLVFWSYRKQVQIK